MISPNRGFDLLIVCRRFAAGMADEKGTYETPLEDTLTYPTGAIPADQELETVRHDAVKRRCEHVA